MAHITSLPNELIRDILKLVQPEDLENFAQTSSHIFSLASPFLTEHRAFIRKYHTLRNTDPRSITLLLSTVIANPRIASYVREVELGPLSTCNVGYTKEELEVFTTAALDSECLKPLSSRKEMLDERHFWSNDLQNGKDDILLAILLPLLPNLVALSVENPSTCIKWYDKAIEQAAFATKPRLRKLARIRLNSSDRYGFSLDVIQRLSTLPSMRVLTAAKVWGRGCLHMVTSETCSAVTHLELWDNCIDSKALYEVLRGFVRLQTFTYSFIHAQETLHDAFLVRASLLAHCKASLQTLTLLGPCARHTTFMGSLRGFETLEELYTEWCYLVPTTHVPNLHLDQHLPASLVRLKIHHSKTREKREYERAIRIAKHARKHRLQELKWLIFGGTRVKWSLETIDQGLRETCLTWE